MKTALVTGASRGIGFAAACALSDAGYHIIAASSAYSEKTEDKFRAAFKNGFTYVYGDVKEKSTVDAYISAVTKLGRLDVLVNNAGIAPPERRDILETSRENFELVMNTNLFSVFFITQSMANLMISFQKSHLCGYSPRIINIGSMSADVSSTSRGEYCISKAGVGMVTMLFADRLAEYSIPVFEIRPGIIKTDMTKLVTEKYDKLIAGGITPIKRWGEPSDIAKAVLALSSGAFDFSTGQVIDVDGGFHLRRL